MQIFSITIFLFFAFFIVHFVIWKIKLPRRQIPALMLICLLVYLGGLAPLLIQHFLLPQIANVSLYYWSVSLCYVITYSAIEGDSPTLSLMRFLQASRNEGRSMAEINEFVNERPFIRSRLTALLDSGLIEQRSTRYVLIKSKPLGFRLILGFRKLYGQIPKGG